MPNLPKRLPYELLIVAALSVASCDTGGLSSDDQTRLRLAEANLNRAAAASSAMVDRVERLERRVEEVESRLRM